MRTPSLTLVNGYARAIESGKKLAGEWVVKACARHLDDLERSKETDYPYIFDIVKAVEAINFIENLPHTKGRWASRSELIVLEPWQLFLIGVLFGWVDKQTGLRRFREAYWEIPRKNGKSVMGAAIGLYMLVADDEFGAEVYSGATTEKQAWEVFKPARLMALRSPALLEHYGLEVNASNLLRAEDYSKFEPLIGNPGDGSSPSCAIVDEYHEHKNADLFDTMQTGMGAREQPLSLVITTAGSNIGGPCYEKRVDAQKILNKIHHDETIFAVIYSLDEGDDWKDEKMWYKANPNLGVSVNINYLTAQVATARRVPSKQSSVKTKHFNQWVGARNAWINLEQWNAGADSSMRREDYKHLPCIMGLDMATRIDIASRLDLFWEDIGDDRHYYAFPHFYLPEGALESSKNADIYRGWSEGGYIDLMDGEEISYNDVERQIKALAGDILLRELAYDPWQTTQMAQNLREDGVQAVEYRNTTANMSPAMREIEGALAGGRWHHPDNPAFNWMASNVVAKEDPNSNIFPRKELPEKKIDGLVAAIMAMGRAMHGEETGSLQGFLDEVMT